MAQADKFPAKRARFLERVSQISADIDLQALERHPELSIRVNTLKSRATFEQPIDWAPHCYWFDGDKTSLTRSAAFEQGDIYLQNASSFIPPLVVNPQPGEHILDMCAAPGGKASHLAAITNNQAELWVNDNSRPRLAKMRANFERLGVVPQTTTLFAINRLAKELPHEHFDKVMLDAPCSGEGMMNINEPKDFEHWSVAHIKRLQSLQKQAVLTAWQLIRPGGLLVYSTCTMAPEENEAVVDYLLRKQENATLEPISLDLPNRIPALTSWHDRAFNPDVKHCLRLGPSKKLEAFFVAAIRKTA